MNILDELKKWTHPYEDEDEEYDDFEEPARQSALRTGSPGRRTAATRWSISMPPPS